MDPDPDGTDNHVVFLMIKSLKELKNGTEEAVEFIEILHEFLCNEDTSDSSGKSFTSLFE